MGLEDIIFLACLSVCVRTMRCVERFAENVSTKRNPSQRRILRNTSAVFYKSIPDSASSRDRGFPELSTCSQWFYSSEIVFVDI